MRNVYLSGLNKSLFLKSILFAGFCFLFLLIFTKPAFEINDDVFINLILSGHYTGTPSPYVFSTNIIYSRFIVWMYSHYPGYNWYSFLLYIFNFSALCAQSYFILKYLKQREARMLGLLLVFVYFLRFSAHLTFTTASAMLAISGVLIVLHPGKLNPKTLWFSYGLGAMFLLLSNIVREGSLDLIAGISLPWLVYTLIKDKNQRWKLCAVILTVAIFAIGMRNYHVNSYPNTPEWNKSRSGLKGIAMCFYTPNLCDYENQKDAYTAGGWSKNDYLMLNSFLYDSETVFSKKSAEIIGKRMNPVLSYPDALRNSLLHMIIILIITFGYMLLSLLLILLYVDLKKRPLVITLGSMHLIVLAGIVYFTFRGYLPNRITLSMVYFCCLSAVLMFCNQEVPWRMWSNRRTILFTFTASLMLVLSGQHVFYKSSHAKSAEAIKHVIGSLPSNKGEVTYIWDSSIPYEWGDAFEDPSYFRKKNFIIGAWTLRTVYNEEIKRRFGITDINASIINDPHVYVLANPYHLNLLKQYAVEHFDKDIKYQVVKDYRQYGVDARLVKVD